jgi:hypothetical protein
VSSAAEADIPSCRTITAMAESEILMGPNTSLPCTMMRPLYHAGGAAGVRPFIGSS